MDESKQNKAKNADFSRKKGKNSDFLQKETPVQILEDKRQKYDANEGRTNQSTSKANFIKYGTINKLKKVEPIQREKINLEEKLENNSDMINHNVNSNKKFNVTTKPNKNINPKNSFKKKANEKTLLATVNHGLLGELDGDIFKFEDMINNQHVLELVEDLVSSFTSNSTLPEKDLQALKEALIERTCYTFANILNNCVTKTFTRVLNSDFIQEKKKKTVQKKDACCQTVAPQFSGDIKKTVEEDQILENIYVYP